MNRLTTVSGRHIEYNLKFLPHLCFEVTEACNLNCVYCAFSDIYTKGASREGTPMSFETAKTIMEYLWHLWEKEDVKSIPTRLNISFYGGEPLMNFPLIEKIIEYAESNAYKINRHITYSMTTNALLLPKYIDYLVDKQFNLLISLDGDQWGDSYRVDHHNRPSFSRVLKNVKMIQKDYPLFFSHNISFNAVLNNRNSYKEIIDFFKTTFDKTPTISPLSWSNLNPNKIALYQSILNTEQTDYQCLPIEQSPALRSFIREYEIKSGNAFYDYNELIYDKEKLPFIPTGTCVPFLKKLFLTAKGEILQCEKIDHSYVLGTVGQNEVQLDADKIAKEYNRRTHAFADQCTSCVLGHYCMKCVYLDPAQPCLRYKKTSTRSIDTTRVSHDLPRAMELAYSSKTHR